MTSVVFDQFMRRKSNQAFFGFFVGLALFALIVLSTVRAGFNPVIGATCALVLTAFALIFVIVLIYTTINQMRPAVIVEAIHNHTLSARATQLDLIQQTRRLPSTIGMAGHPVKSKGDGVVFGIDLRLIGEAARRIETGMGMDFEIVLLVSIGSFVAYEDNIAEIRAVRTAHLETLEDLVRRAVHLDRMRDLERDPAFGIEQLTNIAWTSMSTSKQNPHPGLLIIRSLRDLMARWTVPAAGESYAETIPLVYPDDLLDELMDAFETLAVVCSESMQQQNFAEIVDTFAIMFDRLPDQQQRRAEDAILRMLAGMGDLILTHELDRSLTALANALSHAGQHDTAGAVRSAQADLAESIGRLNSRSTRVPRQ